MKEQIKRIKSFELITPEIIRRIGQFSLMGILGLTVGLTVVEMRKEIEKNTGESVTQIEQLQKSKDILLNPYTIILNNDKNSLTLILKSGMKIDILGLNKIQSDCILFGGGLGCIDDSYLEQISSNNLSEKEKQASNTSLQIPELPQELLGGVGIMFVLSLLWFLVFRVRETNQ